MRKIPLTTLEKELSLALQIASICNAEKRGGAWMVTSPFQDKINELLKKTGRTVKAAQQGEKAGDLSDLTNIGDPRFHNAKGKTK